MNEMATTLTIVLVIAICISCLLFAIILTRPVEDPCGTRTDVAADVATDVSIDFASDVPFVVWTFWFGHTDLTPPLTKNRREAFSLMKQHIEAPIYSHHESKQCRLL